MSGGRFILADERDFYLPGTNKTWSHIATIHYSTREFMYFRSNIDGQTYVEEITGGHLSMIDDDELWFSLTAFLEEKGKTFIAQKT